MKDIKGENILENDPSDKDAIVEELEASGISDETVLIKSSSLAGSLYDSEINQTVNKVKR